MVVITIIAVILLFIFKHIKDCGNFVISSQCMLCFMVILKIIIVLFFLAHNDSNNMTVHKYVGLHLYVLAMVAIAMAIILFYYLFLDI